MLRNRLVSMCVLIMSPLTITMASGQAEHCAAPKYKVAVAYSVAKELEAIAVSVKPKDVTVRNLLALACQLRVDYQNQVEVGAEIFNDEDAAKHTNIHGVENTKGSNEAAYIGSYYLNRSKRIETLTLAVDPNHPCGHDIQVDLRTNSVSIVSCK
jgi:hypothetical protein